MTIPVFVVGQKVLHRGLGEGVVRSVPAAGTPVRVYFDAVGSVVPVEALSLTALGSRDARAPVESDFAAAPTQAPEPALPVTPRMRPASFSGGTAGPDLRRLTVECLRQGLPPPGKLTSWTVGHSSARASIDTAIASAAKGKGSVLFARAGYGQGKSHIGRLGRELAREQGLASFHVELDGRGLSLSAGSRLVAALFASAQLPETGTDHDHLVPGLGTILKRAAPTALKHTPAELRVFAPFLVNPSRWSESDEAIEVLEEYLSGQRSRGNSETDLQDLVGVSLVLPSLKLDWGSNVDRRRRQAAQLGRIVRLAGMAGARGAFVVIDELDHDYQSDTEKKDMMLSELARVAINGPIVLLLLARELEMTGAGELTLGEFSDSEFWQLVEKTIDAFSAAYPSTALARGRKELFGALMNRYRKDYKDSGWGPRFFVRATVECCEATRSQRLESLAQVSV